VEIDFVQKPGGCCIVLEIVRHDDGRGEAGMGRCLIRAAKLAAETREGRSLVFQQRPRRTTGHFNRNNDIKIRAASNLRSIDGRNDETQRYAGFGRARASQDAIRGDRVGEWQTYKSKCDDV
jgi:hypothetical protein